MKKFLAFLMAIVILTSAFSFIVQAVSPRNNHTFLTSTSFTISDTGLAEVYMRYEAYGNNTYYQKAHTSSFLD